MFDWLVDLFTKPANNYGSNNGGAGRQNVLNTSASKNINQNTYGGVKINSTVLLNKREYPVYKTKEGTYYIIKDNNKQPLYGGMQFMEQLKANNNVCINITEDNLNNNNNNKLSKPAETPKPNTSKPTSSSTSTSTSTNTNTTTSTSTPTTPTSSSNVDYYEDRIAKLENENKEFKEKIEELLKEPEVMSAAEAAKHFGIDYNLQNILDDYNTKTKEYYDSAINTQNDLRTAYARNNTQYYDNLLDSYMESYKYAAPTAVGKGTLAANALTNQLNAGNAIAANDYGMMQSVENLKEAKIAELANNPLLAEQYYNNIGTYLSTLTANNHASDVKQRVAELDAYSDMYASSREEEAALANAASTKYAGLANANTYNNSNSGSQVSNFENLYNYFLNRYNGDTTKASKHVNNLLATSGGQTQI